jgi:hypothetical protein
LIVGVLDCVCACAVQAAMGISGGKRQLLWTSESGAMEQCEHFLLYLHRETWTRGPSSRALAGQLGRAMRTGIHILLAHERPDVNGDDDGRRGVKFDSFFMNADGTTPKCKSHAHHLRVVARFAC